MHCIYDSYHSANSFSHFLARLITNRDYRVRVSWFDNDTLYRMQTDICEWCVWSAYSNSTIALMSFAIFCRFIGTGM